MQPSPTTSKTHHKTKAVNQVLKCHKSHKDTSALLISLLCLVSNLGMPVALLCSEWS